MQIDIRTGPFQKTPLISLICNFIVNSPTFLISLTYLSSSGRTIHVIDPVVYSRYTRTQRVLWTQISENRNNLWATISKTLEMNWNLSWSINRCSRCTAVRLANMAAFNFYNHGSIKTVGFLRVRVTFLQHQDSARIPMPSVLQSDQSVRK
jgi:hypothetical protein